MLTPVAPSTSNINDRLQCRRHLGLARQSRIPPPRSSAAPVRQCLYNRLKGCMRHYLCRCAERPPHHCAAFRSNWRTIARKRKGHKSGNDRFAPKAALRIATQRSGSYSLARLVVRAAKYTQDRQAARRCASRFGSTPSRTRIGANVRPPCARSRGWLWKK